MAELALNLDSFNRIDDEIKSQVLVMPEEWELGEETQKSLIEGTAEYKAGKLKTYGSWKDLLADKKKPNVIVGTRLFSSNSK